MEKAFQTISGSQAVALHVNGRCLQMDSKLIVSNIAWSRRFEIIHQTVSLFFTNLNDIALLNEGDSKYYPVLKRVFEEQFKTDDQNKIELRPKEEIKSESVQSTHDTNCSYRKKEGPAGKGLQCKRYRNL